MRVQDVMTEGVKTIGPAVCAKDAWNVMRLNRIHHLVAIEANRVVGVLSERDAGGRRGATVRENSTVADLMTAPAITVEPTMTVRQAANVMRGRSIGGGPSDSTLILAPSRLSSISTSTITP